jgi:hypothetical protein
MSIELHRNGSDFQTSGLYLVIAVVADVALLALWQTKVVSGAVIIAAHLALALGVFMLPGWRTRPAEAVMSSLSILVMGPLGAVGALVLLSAGSRAPEGSAESDEGTYRKASPQFAKTLAAIGEGRAIGKLDGLPTSFAGLIAHGDLSDKQSLLGLISQRYTPDHLATLKHALNSDEAPVRVSAAAVYAKLKEVNRSKVRLAGASEGADPLSRAHQLASAARSGLLDEAYAEAARESALGLLLDLRPAATIPDEIETLICGLMAEAARYDEAETRLSTLGDTLPSQLQSIAVIVQMRSHRFDRLASLAGRSARGAPPASSGKPLLSLARGEQP